MKVENNEVTMNKEEIVCLFARVMTAMSMSDLLDNEGALVISKFCAFLSKTIFDGVITEAIAKEITEEAKEVELTKESIENGIIN